MPPRDFLSLTDLAAAELEGLLDTAVELGRAFAQRTLPQVLAGRSVALWFPDDGFRNRAAFDLGVQLLGGRVVHLPGVPGEREPAADVGAYLSTWFDALVVRASSLAVVHELAAGATVPVVNARTRANHPCEVLGDLVFVRSVRGHLAGTKIVFVGEATNLCRSWVEAAARLPLRVVQVCPPGAELDLAWLPDGVAAGLDFRISYDLAAELEDVDVLYTDAWAQVPDESPADRRARLSPFRITASVLERTPADALFLPCPPVHRDEEVSADALTAPQCRVVEAKREMLHAQNALLALLLDGT